MAPSPRMPVRELTSFGSATRVLEGELPLESHCMVCEIEGLRDLGMEI